MTNASSAICAALRTRSTSAGVLCIKQASTIAVPTGAAIFPKDVPRPSRRWAARRFTDLRHWSEPARGGHFAAFEQPEAYVAELRAFFATVR